MAKSTTTAGAAILLAAGAIAVSPAIAQAEPGHQVTYTLYGGDYNYNVYYRIANSPNQAAENADPDLYWKNETIPIAGGAPWTVTVTLDDPNQAIMTVSSTQHGGRGAPNPTCEIAVDGQQVSKATDLYNPRCQVAGWVPGAAPAQEPAAEVPPADAAPAENPPAEAPLTGPEAEAQEEAIAEQDTEAAVREAEAVADALQEAPPA